MDNNNCGTCGNIVSRISLVSLHKMHLRIFVYSCLLELQCPGSTVCLSGTCTTVCTSPQVTCGTDFVDLTTDPNNCGACGTVVRSFPFYLHLPAVEKMSSMLIFFFRHPSARPDVQAASTTRLVPLLTRTAIPAVTVLPKQLRSPRPLYQRPHDAMYLHRNVVRIS